VFAAWKYTGGRTPYGYRALGEAMVFLFFGLVAVVGTTYVQTESLPLASWYAAVGVGALACAILVANNLRDIPTDREVGKRTLAVMLSTSRLALLGLGFVLPVVPATRLVLSGAAGRDLVPVLQRTGVAELLWAAGVFVGLVVAALV
jgi:1,4-dihydroxy-2-naphthoate octaprenyltransferase